MKQSQEEPEGREISAPAWRRFVAPALSLALFALALWALHRALGRTHYRELVASFRAIPGWRLATAGALTAANYLVLTGYDGLALRYLRNPLPYRKVALASFVGYAFANNTGSLSVLAAGGVRYRLYAGWGLSAPDVARVVGFCTLTFWLGFLALGGVAFLVEPVAIPQAVWVPFGEASLHVLGGLFVALVAGYLGWAAARRGPIRLQNWEIEVPSLGLSLAQVVVSAADWALAGSVLYILLPGAPGLSLPLFLALFLLAQVAGLASAVPGGLGVFETAMVLLLASWLPAPAALGPLIAFRGIYYLAPLIAAVFLFAAEEALRRWNRLGPALLQAWSPLATLVPHLLALGTLASGAVLLLSGATPALPHRLAWLSRVVPLPVLEASHFLASVVGAALLVLARSLSRRIDAAYYLTAALLGVGITASLLKGLDWEEALLLAIVLCALLPNRRQFRRHASLLADPFSAGWTTAALALLGASLWLGFFAHRHVEYRGELWWHFALGSDAPRFLRASVGAVAVVLFFSLAWLLRPSRRPPGMPAPADLEAAAAVAAQATCTEAYLALLGDKHLLFDDDRTAFLMYGVRGRSWVAMGDPVGPPDAAAELVWRFRGLSDRAGTWPAFYEVGADRLPLYLDLGLLPWKLGENARVPLAGFGLDGSARKGLRAVHNRLRREGYSVEVVPPAAVGSLLPELRAVSDAWLRAKNTREKGFSLGFFREDYLTRFPCALVRQGKEVLAFANLWPGGGKEELAADLMRFAPGAPNGTMDYLFTELLLWGKDQGYRWFDLGMAPLSGLENRSLAPLWARVGAFLFRYGEHFYNFQGLRAYKEKFDPVWEPRYLAAPGGLALPRILLDLAALVSGGVRGIVAK
jgi:phosphatidylglycerol lysyltransferase